MKSTPFLKFTILFFVFFLISLAIWQAQRSGKIAVEHFTQFYTTDIDGIILRNHTAHKGAYFQLEDGSEYVFYPRTNSELNNSRIFTYTAEKGDRVVKPAFSDTLRLIKDDMVLLYLFTKYE